MQKSAVSTFSATDKDALLDQFKAIVDAGELTMRSDSSTIAHLDSHEIARYTRAIESLNLKHGWHLDAQDVLLRLDEFKRVAELKGGKCSESRGWYGLKGNCKRGKKGEAKAKAKESKAQIADRIRSRKKMSTIASRDGRLKNGSWDISAAYRPGKETQSSLRAKRTGPNNSRTLNPDRAARIMAKEEARARVNWGKTTGDWGDKPRIGRSIDNLIGMPDPKSAPRTTAPTPIATQTASKAPPAGSRSQRFKAMTDRLKQNQEADAMNAAGIYTVAQQALTKLGSTDTVRPGGQGRSTTRALPGEAPKGARGRIKALTDRLKQNQEADNRNAAGVFAVAKVATDKLAAKQEATVSKMIEQGKPQTGGTRKMNSQGDRIRGIAAKLKEEDKIQAGATFGILKKAEKLYENQDRLIKEVSDMVNEDLDRESGQTSSPARASKRKSTGTRSAGQKGKTTARKTNEAKPVTGSGDRIRGIADRLKDEQNIQKFATGGIIKAAGQIYDNQNRLIKEVSEMVNEDLDREAKNNKPKMIDPARTPVQIANSRSSNEPRRRGRSVD